MKKLFRSIPYFLTFFIFLIYYSSSCFACFATPPMLAPEGKVIQLIIQDRNGQLQSYFGKQAEQIYQKLEKNTNKELIEQEEIQTISKANKKPSFFSNFHISLNGIYRYQYRFTQQDKGTTWGKCERVSPYYANDTSTSQSHSLEVTSSVSYYHHKPLANNFLTAFGDIIGKNWLTSVHFSQKHQLTVAPNKCVWIEFKPKLNYVQGTIEKYYIPSHTKKPIITEKQHVFSTSPSTITINTKQATSTDPEGAFIIKESNVSHYQ